jgi:hypothetical protein
LEVHILIYFILLSELPETSTIFTYSALRSPFPVFNFTASPFF